MRRLAPLAPLAAMGVLLAVLATDGSQALYLPLVRSEAVSEVEPAPERRLDPRLEQLGVWVEEAEVAPGEAYWRVVEIVWKDEQEAQGGHSLRWNVLDEAGRRIIGQAAIVAWGGGSVEIRTEEKPENEYSANFAMYAAGCSYSLRVEGLPSDVVHCLGLGTPEARAWTIHTEFWILFQRDN